MNGVFLDTVGMLAVWDESDQWHESASRALQQLLNEKVPLMTTEYVLLECGNAAARRPYRGRVIALRQQLIAGELLHSPTSDELEEAWRAFDKCEADAAGIVDQVSFVVMRRLGLTKAFTNDRHYRAAGIDTCW